MNDERASALQYDMYLKIHGDAIAIASDSVFFRNATHIALRESPRAITIKSIQYYFQYSTLNTMAQGRGYAVGGHREEYEQQRHCTCNL